MTLRTLAFAAVGALALSYGLIASLDLQGSSESPSVAGSGDLSTTSSALKQTRRDAATDSQRVIGDVRTTKAAAPNLGSDSPDPMLALDGWSDEPPVEIGEPMDPDDDFFWDVALAEEGPIDIGPELDADDPSAWATDEPSAAPIDIGEPLDPEDPESWSPTESADGIVEIGYELDPDDPEGWVPDDELDAPTEIGEFLPVEGPST